MSNLQPGMTLGPYRLISQIGQGGMATVYKAYHAAMDRYVAIKVLPPLFARGDEFHERFQQEARTIGKLEHPRILPVYDYGESEGLAYLVMRYLDAGTLKERMAQRLTLAEVDHYFAQIADALAYAHERGVVHRDIKPANVLVDARGDAFLTDFGIAKLLESPAGLTKTDVMLGTPQYMSPEQARAEKVDHRSDIYSLGIVLYEMVTGRVPFEAETPLAVAIQHVTAPLPLPSAINPNVPPAIERVILKALAKSRDDRYASMAEFLAAWRQALRESEPATLGVSQARGTVPAAPETSVVYVAAPAAAPAPAAPVAAPVPAAPISVAAPAAPAGRRRPAWWVFAGLAVAAVAVLLGLLAFRNFIVGRARTAGEATQQVYAATGTALATRVAGPTTVATPAIAGTGGFTSWVAGNHVYSLALAGDSLFAAGPGGITVWNRKTKEYRRITRLEGLPSAQVYTVLADTDGTLWVGMDAGASHYFPSTGEWAVYAREAGLDSDYVTALLRLPDGRLLAATSYGDSDGQGLNVFDGAWQPFSADFPSVYGETPPSGSLSSNVNALCLGPDGTLWVGTQHGLGHYADGRWQRYFKDDGLPGNNVFTFLADRDGVLWVGTDHGAARIKGSVIEAVPELAEVWVSAALQASDGTYWLAGGSFIARYASGAYDWTWGDHEDVGSRNWVTIVQDADDVLWFGSSDGGVLRYDGQRRELWEVPGVPRVVAVDRILPAPDGSLWVVASDGVADRLAPGTGEWTPALTGDLCCEFAPYAFLPDGTLLGGGNGLWVARDGHAERLDGLPSENVSAVAQDGEGRLWVGTDGGLAVVKDGAVAHVFTKESGYLPVNCVQVLFTAGDGTVWIGLDEGHLVAAHPDGNFETFSAGDAFDAGTVAITGIAETPDRRLWVATDGGGIYVRDGERWQRFEHDMPVYVSALAVAPDGTPWFGFAEEGVGHWDGARWQRYTIADGLLSNSVRSLYVSPDGPVWIGTDSGVVRLTP